MAFFSEIKARLGLDITPFEKGMAKAQSSVKQVTTEMGKNMAGVKGLIGFAAISSGFNNALNRAKELRDTAEETGTALDPAVRRTAEMADNLERGKDALETAAIDLTGAIKYLVDAGVAGFSQMIGIGSAPENFLAIQQREKADRDAVANARKAAKAKEKAATDEKSLNASVATQVEEAMKAQEELREKALTNAKKLEQSKARIGMLEAVENDQSKSALDRATAKANKGKEQLKLVTLIADQEKEVTAELDSFFGEIDKKTEAASKAAEEATNKKRAAEEKRTDELKDQLKTLKDQKTTIEQTLAAQAKSAKASIEDIVSGKRQVGGTTKANAQKLLAARSEEQRRIDAVSQAEDTLANSGKGLTGAAKEAAQAELDRRKASLAATQGRKSDLESVLKDKTSETFAAEQVAELKNVVAEIVKTNKALAPASITSNT